MLSVLETTSSSEKQREFGILAIKIWSSCLDTAPREFLIIGITQNSDECESLLLLRDHKSSIITTECYIENLHDFCCVQDVCLSKCGQWEFASVASWISTETI